MFGLMQDRPLLIQRLLDQAARNRGGTEIVFRDDVQFVEAIPLPVTGKILKTRPREEFKDYKLPTG